MFVIGACDLFIYLFWFVFDVNQSQLSGHYLENIDP